METADENSHCKSVFAHAGAALNQAQVLEAAVQNVLILSGIVTGEIADYADFDKLDERLRKYTLGRLLREFRQDATLNGRAEEIIGRALDRRNFVAHHFFKERAVELTSRAGRDAMIDELVSYENLFLEAELIISSVCGAMRTHLGITDEHIKQASERLVSKAK